MKLWGRRSEQRAMGGGADFTDQAIARSEALAAGGAEAGDLAITGACISLWERALSAATVEPASAPLMPISDARLLALVGRSLATTGNFVAVIRVADGVVALLPASGYDVTGGADPLSWIYRCDLIGPSASHAETMTGDAVVHVRIGADARTPWRGRGCLQTSPKTATLAARIEAALAAEMALPIGRIAPFNGADAQMRKYADEIVRGGIIAGGPGLAIGGPGGTMEASSRLKPQAYGPEPNQVTESLRTSTGQDIVNAYGIPPVIFDARGDGSARREAYRQFMLSTVAPVGALLQAELRDKLDDAAAVGFDALAAHDVDARSRAVARRATAYKTLREFPACRTMRREGWQGWRDGRLQYRAGGLSSPQTQKRPSMASHAGASWKLTTLRHASDKGYKRW